MSNVAEVLAQRLATNKPIDFCDRSFAAQTKFLEDKSPLKAAFCTRRAGKSYGAALALVQTAYENPGCNCIYVALTRASAKKIIWKDCLKEVNRKFNLNATFNLTELTLTLPNNSIIYVLGMDSDEQEREKALGQKLKIAVIDEAGSFTTDLKQLVYATIKPALSDQRGQLLLIGTPSNQLKGLFYDVTRGVEPGWSVHRWTAPDNPHMAAQWAAELAEIERDRPLFKQTPMFKQHYLGEWVVEADKLVYKYSAIRNSYSNLPNYIRGEWTYLLGVDLGYSPDPSAFVVAAFHEHDPILYILETYKATEMDIEDVANKIKEFKKRYPILKTVIDNANVQAVETIQRRHNVALTAADKTGKADFIEIMNAELIQGKIKAHATYAEALTKEWSELVWKEKNGQIDIPRKENPALANHLCDAALYAWRHCYSYLFTKDKPPVDLRTDWVKHSEQLMADALQKQIDKEIAEEQGNDIWNLSNMDINDNPLNYYLNKRKNR